MLSNDNIFVFEKLSESIACQSTYALTHKLSFVFIGLSVVLKKYHLLNQSFPSFVIPADTVPFSSQLQPTESYLFKDLKLFRHSSQLRLQPRLQHAGSQGCRHYDFRLHSSRHDCQPFVHCKICRKAKTYLYTQGQFHPQGAGSR